MDNNPNALLSVLWAVFSAFVLIAAMLAYDAVKWAVERLKTRKRSARWRRSDNQ